MAELWTPTLATASLRTRLSDGPTDKYVHLSVTDPSPDGQTVDFAVPDDKLVVGSLRVYLNGVELTPLSIDAPAGSFVIDPPDEAQALRASYYFQWFTDAELQEFLTLAVRLLKYDSIADAGLPVALRTPVISFAAYYAYMKKAAHAAPALVAANAGFSSDNSQEHPNWLALAKQAWEEGKAALELIGSNPVATQKPAMKFVAYRLSRYVPRT